MKKTSVPYKNPGFKKGLLLALAGVMISQSSLASISINTSITTKTPVADVDRLEILIKQIENKPLTESEKQLLQDVDAVVETQVTNQPSKDEIHLTFKEKILLSKIVTAVMFRGLNNVFHTLSPASILGLSTSRLKDLSEQDLSIGEESILKLFASLINRNALTPYLQHKMDMIAKIPFIGSGFKKD
ncbi:MAG: hypothetical protein ACKOX6_08165, partial [Bdellovibrio sp.]